MLRKGYDIATVRKQLGHKPGSEATFRYLAPLQIDIVRKKGIDELFGDVVDWELGETSEASQTKKAQTNAAVEPKAERRRSEAESASVSGYPDGSPMMKVAEEFRKLEEKLKK